MTFFTLTPTLTLVAAVAAAPSQTDCSLAAPPPHQRAFTNADLERLAACRYQTGAQSEVGTDPPPAAPGPTRRRGKASAPNGAPQSAVEADWRARWRSVDQRARKLRQQAWELRQEAAGSPRDPKRQPSGRRSRALLEGRAKGLETEARELEEEFQEQARREGALPGWLRPKSR